VRQACFIQAGDGIRGFHVTGVQTCALPISAEKLKRYGIEPINQLRAYPREWFLREFGRWGEEIYDYVHWRDDRPLVLERERKSKIGRATGRESTHNNQSAGDTRAHHPSGLR